MSPKSHFVISETLLCPHRVIPPSLRHFHVPVDISSFCEAFVLVLGVLGNWETSLWYTLSTKFIGTINSLIFLKQIVVYWANNLL